MPDRHALLGPSSAHRWLACPPSARLGVPANQRQRLALLREVCETMHARIDDVFGEGTARICFGGALDLDAIWDFFDGIAPELDTAQQERIKRYTQRRGNRQQRRALKK